MPLKTPAWIFIGCWIATLCVCQVTMADAGSPGILSAHQEFRAEVGSPALVYSDSIAAGAQDWADYLAANALFKHSGSNYGENIFVGSSGYYSWADAINYWGSEKKYFIYGPFGDQSSTTGHWYDVGHYTQVIWYSTSECGCGKATGYYPAYASSMDVFVCRYNPPGNYLGQYPYPVPAPTPTSTPTVVPTTSPTPVLTTSPTPIPTTTIPTTIATTSPTTVPTTFLPAPPKAAFSVAMIPGSTPFMVLFTDTSTNNPGTWAWYFGDGTPNASVKNPVHRFSKSGHYTVILTASNTGGRSTTTRMIDVNISAWPYLLKPLPGSVLPDHAPSVPRDLNGDGLYEDVNGDGVYDYSDILDFFTYLSWVTHDFAPVTDTTNEYQPFFDYDQNNVVDFYDVISLFYSLPPLI